MVNFFCEIEFDIESFDNKTLVVSKNIHKYNDLDNETIIKDCKENMTKMREDIVKIWMENQSKLPKFNFEDYK